MSTGRALPPAPHPSPSPPPVQGGQKGVRRVSEGGQKGGRRGAEGGQKEARRGSEGGQKGGRRGFIASHTIKQRTRSALPALPDNASPDTHG
eukprot:1182616-Prorocentrum_minimum.AAC.1